MRYTWFGALLLGFLPAMAPAGHISFGLGVGPAHIGIGFRDHFGPRIHFRGGYHGGYYGGYYGPACYDSYPSTYYVQPAPVYAPPPPTTYYEAPSYYQAPVYSAPAYEPPVVYTAPVYVPPPVYVPSVRFGVGIGPRFYYGHGRYDRFYYRH